MKLEISKRARRHIEKRQAWWGEHRPEARHLFLDELAAAERQLRAAPSRAPGPTTAHGPYSATCPGRRRAKVARVRRSQPPGNTRPGSPVLAADERELAAIAPLLAPRDRTPRASCQRSPRTPEIPSPMYDVRALNELVAKESAFVDRLTNEVGKVIIGQQYMIERILVGLLTGGHVLLEGVPGLAKTLTVRTLCDAISRQVRPRSVHSRPLARRPHRNGHL